MLLHTVLLTITMPKTCCRCSMTDKARRERERERREQYKQVRAHVKKDDGRMQAYGWSLPAKVQTGTGKDGSSGGKSSAPIPVPVYCRPLNDQDADMKVGANQAANSFHQLQMYCHLSCCSVRCV